MNRVLYMDVAPFCGGAQESLWALTQALPEEDAFMLFGTGLWPRAKQNGMPGIPIDVRHWPASICGLWQLWGDAKKAAPAISNAMTLFSPTVIHANTVRSALLLLAAGIRLPCPVIIHDRDIRMPRFLCRILAKKLNPVIVAISSTVAAKWHRIIDQEKLKIIPNGFDLASIAGTAPCPPIFPDDTFRLIMVADFEPWKRHSLLLQALAIAKDKCPALRCLVKGRVRSAKGEQLLNDLQKTVSRLGMDGIVVFNREPIPALPFIAASDALVACSQNEPFGRTLIEALALGKPIASTLDGGPPEILADCPAIHTAKAAPDALAEAILSWQLPEKRIEQQENAMEKSRQFTIDKLTAEIKTLHSIGV